MNNRNGGQQRQVVLPEPADMGSIILHGATGFARRHKVVTGSYLFGILVLLLAGSGTRLTLEQRRDYNAIMDTIDIQAEFAQRVLRNFRFEINTVRIRNRYFENTKIILHGH